jgi:hypothetical protein
MRYEMPQFSACNQLILAVEHTTGNGKPNPSCADGGGTNQSSQAAYELDE